MEGKELGPLRATKFNLPNDQRIGKPPGFWVSVDGECDWLSWCRSEDFCTQRPWRHYRVELVDKPNLLHLQTAQQLDDFTDKWADPVSRSNRVLGTRRMVYDLLWEKLAREYKGIVISPYIWERRLEISWYYSWDCASGVVWDVSAIKSVTSLGMIKHPVGEAA